MAGTACAGHAEGVADGDGAAIDIVLLWINAELVAAIEALRGKGFVQFPKVDVLNAQAMTRQKLWHGKDWTNAHLVGLTTGNRKAPEQTQGLKAALFGFLGIHQHHSRSTVRQLRGITSGDEIAFTLNRLQGGQALKGRVGAVTFVLIDDIVDDGFFARGLVEALHLGGHGDDFVVEQARRLRGGNQLLRAEGIFVLIVSADIIALGHDVGSVDHGHP